MAKVETARERIGDFFPPIENCSRGSKFSINQLTKGTIIRWINYI